MADEEKKFTHVGIEIETQKQIAILAKVHGSTIYDLVGAWADASWEQAEKAGLVTPAMLKPQKAHVVAKINLSDLNKQDGKKLMDVVKVRKAVKA